MELEPNKIRIQKFGQSRFPLDACFQGVKRLLVLAFDNTDNGAKKVERNSYTKYFLPKGRNIYDQPINDSIKQWKEIRKTATGQ